MNQRSRRNIFGVLLTNSKTKKNACLFVSWFCWGLTFIANNIGQKITVAECNGNVPVVPACLFLFFILQSFYRFHRTLKTVSFFFTQQENKPKIKNQKSHFLSLPSNIILKPNNTNKNVGRRRGVCAFVAVCCAFFIMTSTHLSTIICWLKLLLSELHHSPHQLFSLTSHPACTSNVKHNRT